MEYRRPRKPSIEEMIEQAESEAGPILGWLIACVLLVLAIMWLLALAN